MGSSKRRIKSKCRKRQFASNQFTNKKESGPSSSHSKDSSPPTAPSTSVLDNYNNDDETTSHLSASAKKIKLSKSNEINSESKNWNLIMNYEILYDIVNMIGYCPDCGLRIEMSLEPSLKKGFVHKTQMFIL